jgi:DNA-directed RNA polymerase specialized sigma24 family protein
MTTDENPAAARSEFASTHWSLILAAGDRDRPDAGAALARLCETYWYPLYAYVRCRVADLHEAQDITQAFFERLLEHWPFDSADPARGRFRAFLLTACQRFLINEWHKGRAAKRGGGRRPLSLDFGSGESKLGLVAVDTVTAEQLYEQQWAITLLERVMELLRAEYEAKQRLPHFETLKPFLAGSPTRAAYAEAARSLGISETYAKVAAHRMRKRYRELLRAEIAQTVERPEDVDDEVRDLFAVFGGEKSGKCL